MLPCAGLMIAKRMQHGADVVVLPVAGTGDAPQLPFQTP